MQVPKVSDEHRAARREEIIVAALRVFGTKGFKNASMADIIGESGMSAGAIYSHFSGKRELIVSAALRTMEARLYELDISRKDDDPLSPAEIITVIIRGMRNEKFSHFLLQIWAEAAVSPDFLDIIEEGIRPLQSTIHDHLVAWAKANPERSGPDPSAWADNVTPILMSIGQGFMVQRVLIKGFDEEAYLAAIPMALTH